MAGLFLYVRCGSMGQAILGYRSSGCYGALDQLGGWSFALYRKGTVWLKTYLVNGDVISSRKIQIPQKAADAVYHKLKEQAAVIRSLPDKTNNRSCDGSYDRFNFLGKRTISLNICSVPEDWIRAEEVQGLIDAEFAATLRAETAILKVFQSVVPFLEPYGLQVDFDVFACEWEGVDY